MREKDAIIMEDVYRFIPAEDSSKPHVALFYAFNTEITLNVWSGAGTAESACRLAREQCRIFERLFSRTLPHSDIARLNEAGGKKVALDEKTYELLTVSKEFCRRSLGLFDITIGSVIRLWNFKDKVIPLQEKIDEALTHVNYELLQLGGAPGKRYGFLEDPLASVDVGGTAKGYIADRLCELFRVHGVEHFLINLGGNVAVGDGKPDGSPFNVGIRDPKDGTKVLSAVQITNGSVVTSGLTERCFYLEGVRYCHILDPATGRPISTDAESATVVAQTGTVCDGLSTTICALGIEKGIAFSRQQQDIYFSIFVDKDIKLYSSI